MTARGRAVISEHFLSSNAHCLYTLPEKRIIILSYAGI
nr:MAG TPA: hypothetical protein [Caudoviricetes sp.]